MPILRKLIRPTFEDSEDELKDERLIKVVWLIFQLFRIDYYVLLSILAMF